jgi:hypothetical protein
MCKQWRKTKAFAACLAIATAVSFSSAALCQEAPAAAKPAATSSSVSRLEGDLAQWPAVTLAFDDVPASRAVAEIAKQLGLGFVAPKGAGEEKRIALSLEKRPGREALEAVLEIAGMHAAIRNGLLIATPEAPIPAPPSPAVAPVPSAPPVPATTPLPPEADGGKRHRHRDKGADDLVRFGGPARVEAGQTVGDAVAMGGPLAIAGHVLGDAVAIGGPVTVEATAVVEGDLVSIGGSMDVAPEAEVRGDRVGIGGPFGSMIGKFAGGVAAHQTPMWQLALLDAAACFVKCAVLLLIGLLVITFLPDRYARVREHLTQRPGRSALAGLIMFLAIVPAIVVLAVTVVGIPLIPIAVLILVALMSVGMTAFIAWLGDRVPLFKGRKSQFGAMAIGAAVVFLVMLVPILGALLLVAASFTAAGAALMSRFGAPPKDDAIANGPGGAPATF